MDIHRKGWMCFDITTPFLVQLCVIVSCACYIAHFIIRSLSWLSKGTYAQKAYTEE